MQTIIDNPSKAFYPDPNGFLVTRDPIPQEQIDREKARKAAAVAELSKSRGTLFDKLVSMDTSAPKRQLESRPSSKARNRLTE